MASTSDLAHQQDGPRIVSGPHDGELLEAVAMAIDWDNLVIKKVSWGRGNVWHRVGERGVTEIVPVIPPGVGTLPEWLKIQKGETLHSVVHTRLMEEITFTLKED